MFYTLAMVLHKKVTTPIVSMQKNIEMSQVRKTKQIATCTDCAGIMDGTLFELTNALESDDATNNNGKNSNIH